MKKATKLAACVTQSASAMLCAMLLTSVASGQANGVISGQVISLAGIPQPFATVRICAQTASGIPCTPVASIYADPNLTIPLTNPTAANQYGYFSVFVGGSTSFYQVQTTYGNVTYPYWAAGNGASNIANQQLGYVPLNTSGVSTSINAVAPIDVGVSASNIITMHDPVTANVNGVVNVAAPPYNAVGDYNVNGATGCTLASGSTTLNCTGGQFQPGDVGLVAYVPGAGLTQSSSVGALATTIAAYVSHTQVTLAAAALTAVSTPENVGMGHDNSSAIQNAINHCYTNKCSVYFPANPAIIGTQTAYFNLSTLNPLGVPLFGPPGAAGYSDGTPAQFPVVVEGAPGLDVFAVPDPTTSGWQAPLENPTVRDLAILVDDSLDASSSGTNAFPYRLPGRTVYDLVCTSSSAVVTSVTAMFQPGDVGQAFEAYGCGASGANLITTISSWQSSTQVTLAAAASTPQSAAQAYISVMFLSATQTLGNACYAYNAKDFTFTSNLIERALFQDMIANTIDNQQRNNTAGFVFQGDFAPYQSLWEHDNIEGTFPMAGLQPPTVAPPTNGWMGWGDFNIIRDTWTLGPYGLLFYDGSEGTLENIQMANTFFGPTIIQAYGNTATSYGARPNTWSIDVPEIEATGACATGTYTMRLSGLNHTVKRLSSQNCSSGSNSLQWDAFDSELRTWNFNGTLSNLYVTGNHNRLAAPLSGPSYTETVTGIDNTFVTGFPSGSGSFVGTNPGRTQYAGGRITTFPSPLLSRQAIAMRRTADFLEKGAANYYYNNDDLWFWPDDVKPNSGQQGTNVYDVSSPTGRAVQFAAGTALSLFINELNGTIMTIGQQVPATKVHISFEADSVGGSQSFFFDAGYQSGTYPSYTGFHSLGCSQTVTVTTTYAVVATCDVDLSSYAGQPFMIRLGNSSTLTYTVNVAWMGTKVWNADIEAQSLLVGGIGAPAVTGNQGNGALLQHSTGTTTTNDYAKFDSNGNVVDGGSIPASAAVLGTNGSSQLVAATPHQVALPLQCADTSSSPTTYTCTTTPTLGALTKGDIFVFTSINQNNSGSSTLNIDSIGAKTIRKWQNTANLASGDLQSGAALMLVYDGTYLEAPTIGNAPSGGCTWAAPYSTCSSTLYLPDGYAATLPGTFSGLTWWNSSAPTGTNGTNGNLILSTTGNGTYYYEERTCSSSIVAEISGVSAATGASPYIGIQLYDSTNTKIYVLAWSSALPASQIQVLTSVVSGGTPGAPSLGNNVPGPFPGTTGYSNLKISVSGGTLTMAASVDGGISYSTISTYSSIGTITKGGIFYYDGSGKMQMNVASEVCN